MTENLFSYGTLQSASVQLKTFGRTLEGYPDEIPGYKLSLVKIEDEALIASIGMTHHQNISFTGNPSDLISGTVLQVSEAELKQADVYEEPADYTRMQVNLKSGKKAWVYAWANTQTK